MRVGYTRPRLFRARRHSCAQSRSQQSCSLLFRFLVGRALTVRGARITSSTRIAVSIRMSNVRPHVQETADFAREIHSQRMALRGNRKGVFGATSKYPPAEPGALVLEPLEAAYPCRSSQASLHSVNASPSAVPPQLGKLR